MTNSKQISRWQILKKPESIINILLILILIALEIAHNFLAEILSFERFVRVALLLLILATSAPIFRLLHQEDSLETLKNDVKNLKEAVEKTSKSFIDAYIGRFSRDELIDFMMKCTEKMNKFENISSSIYRLYRKHGLLELANEPRKSSLSLVYRNDGEIEGDKIKLTVIQDYMATNEAKLKTAKNKRLNGNGLVAYLGLDVNELDENKISEEIRRLFNTNLKFTASFPICGIEYKDKELCPYLIISQDDFDDKKCTKKGEVDNEHIEPKLYGVYKISKQKEYYKVNLGLYFNIEIPPQDHIDFHIETQVIVPNFYLWVYEFVTWTNGVDFKLDFDDEFETDIGYVLTGGTPSYITRKQLIYNEWIIPHSSISAVWKKKTPD